MFARTLIAAALFLAACAAPPPSDAPAGASIAERHASLSAEVAGTPTEALCKRHEGGADPLLIQMIEAELAARQAAACAVPRFVAFPPKNTYPRPAASGDRDCSDFAAPAEAQRFFLAAGGPAFDSHDLDADGDGAACAWAAARAEVAIAARPAPGPAGVYQKGPRGGCYTFTSSGRKRYVSRDRC